MIKFIYIYIFSSYLILVQLFFLIINYFDSNPSFAKLFLLILNKLLNSYDVLFLISPIKINHKNLILFERCYPLIMMYIYLVY